METKRYISLDTACFITDGLSINDILSHLLRCDIVKDSSKVIVQAMGTLDCRGFKYNGIQFAVGRSELRHSYADIWEVDCKEYDGSFFKNGFFEYPFEHLRTYISGEGMRFLRNSSLCGDLIDQQILYLQHSGASLVPIERQRFVLEHFGLDFSLHFTRIDLAIDVINDSTDFIKEVYSTYFNGMNGSFDSSIIFGSGDQGARALHFEAKYSEFERSLYLGSKNSSELMRVYDKYLESTRGAPGSSLNPDVVKFSGIDTNDIVSWTRFECQFRAKACGKWLPNEDDAFCILHDPFPLLNYIRTRYAMRTRGGSSLPFWDDYFKIFSKAPILYNEYFVEFKEEYKSGINTAEKYMGSAFLPWIESHCTDYKDLPQVVFKRVLEILCPSTDGQWKQQFSFFRRYHSTGKEVFDSGFLSSLFDINSWSYSVPEGVTHIKSFLTFYEKYGNDIWIPLFNLLSDPNFDSSKFIQYLNSFST